MDQSRRFFLSALYLALVSFLTAGALHAQSAYIVTTTADADAGVYGNCTLQTAGSNGSDAACSLRDAFAAVDNAAPTGSTQPLIQISPTLYSVSTPATITLVQGVISVAHNFNLTVPLNNGATQLTLSGNNITGILKQTGAGTYSTVAGVTLTAGKSATGGAWSSSVASTVTFTNDIFYANVSTTTGTVSGGAIYLSGGPTVTITGCSFSNNTASTSGSLSEGGALHQSAGTLTIANSTFDSNTAMGTSSLGGAIYLAGVIWSATSSSFTNNTAGSGTTGSGGAIYTTSSSATLTNSLFSANTATGTSATAQGGALYMATGTNTLTGNTFTGNMVNGFSGNTHQGGAIYNTGVTTLYNDTITANSSNSRTGGVYSFTGVTVAAYNTVISGNSATSGITGVDEFDVTNTAGNYIDASTTSACTANCTPLLSALGSYGGPTIGTGAYATQLQTMIPLPGSPLLRAGNTSDIGAGSTITCNGTATVTDARGCGYPRTLNSYVDTGATEANYSAAFATQPPNSVAGSAITPAPAVQLYETGVLFNPGAHGSADVMSITASSPTLSGTTTGVAVSTAGIATFSGLSISPIQNGETLTASLPLDGTSTNFYTVTSNSFNIISPIGFVTPPASPIAGNGNAGTVTVQEYAGGGTAYISSDVMTLTVTGPSSYSQTYTATSTTGTFSFNLSAVPLATLGSYTYTASDSTYTTQTAVATETVAGAQSINFTQPTTPAFVNGTATLVATGGASGNPVTFSIVSGPATVSGSNGTTITYNGVGTVVIAANQAAGGSYPAATQVTQTVTVVNQSVFVVNSGGSVTTAYENGGSQSAATSGGGIGAAVDAAGYVWSINTNGSGVSLFTDAGALSTSYSGASISGATALAIDGNNITWIANGNGTVSALTNAGVAVGSTPIDPASGMAAPVSISVDTAGSLWLAIPNITTPSSSTVIEVIGSASPISTPTVTQVINSTPGTKP